LDQIVRQGVSGFIGATNSDVSQVVSFVAQIFTMPQITYASTSPVFDDKTQYPTFFRGLPVLTGQVRVDFMAFISQFSQFSSSKYVSSIDVRVNQAITTARLVKLLGYSVVGTIASNTNVDLNSASMFMVRCLSVFHFSQYVCS
jgi:hypothetical protein